MTSNGFKNALIGDKLPSEVSWPPLNETHKIKRSNRNKLKNLVSNQPFSNESNDVDVLSKKNDESELEEPQTLPFSKDFAISLTGEGSQLKKDEFPELATPFCRKKQPLSGSKNTITRSNVPVRTSEKPGSKCSYKHPKLKQSIVNLPLLSFVKAPRLKKRFLHKKITPSVNTLCGNKLDKDQPVRRKGKVRLHAKKFESRLKKEIILSRSVQKRKIVYSQNILKAKCLLPSIINSSNDLNAGKLESLLLSLKIEEIDQGNVQDINEEINQENTIQNELASHDFKKKFLHSQAFREYCTNVVSSALLKSVESLITTLRKFQDRLHAKEPVKAFAKRRYVCGFKEATKFLQAEKVKVIVVATNLQLDPNLPSGRVLEEIKNLTEKYEVPLIFAGKGNQIGYWTLKKRRISIVSILNYEGAEMLYQDVIKHWEECKELYKSVSAQIEQLLPDDESSEEKIPKNVEEQIRNTLLSKLSSGQDEKEDK